MIFRHTVAEAEHQMKNVPFFMPYSTVHPKNDLE